MKHPTLNHDSRTFRFTSPVTCVWDAVWIGISIFSSWLIFSCSFFFSSSLSAQTVSNDLVSETDGPKIVEAPTQTTITRLDASSLRDLHPWSDTPTGSWKRCLIMTETLDEKGQTLFSSTRENRITLEAFEPAGARLRIESTVELSASEMGESAGSGKNKRVVFDPHPRIVIEPFLPGLPNISVVRPEIPGSGERKSDTPVDAQKSLLDLPERSSDLADTFGVPVERGSEGEEAPSVIQPPIVPGILPMPAPGLRPLLPIRSRGEAETADPAKTDSLATENETVVSGDSAGTLRFGKVQSETLLIDGRSILCSVQTVSYEDTERRIVSVLYYNKQVVPYLFRRKTTIHHRKTDELLTEQTFEVHSLEKQLVFRRGEPQRRFIQSRLSERAGGNETTTYMLSLPEVPGRVVRYTMGQKNSKGRLLSAVSMSLLDFGSGEIPPQIESTDAVLPSDARPTELSLPAMNR